MQISGSLVPASATISFAAAARHQVVVEQEVAPPTPSAAEPAPTTEVAERDDDGQEAIEALRERIHSHRSDAHRRRDVHHRLKAIEKGIKEELKDLRKAVGESDDDGDGDGLRHAIKRLGHAFRHALHRLDHEARHADLGGEELLGEVRSAFEGLSVALGEALGLAPEAEAVVASEDAPAAELDAVEAEVGDVEVDLDDDEMPTTDFAADLRGLLASMNERFESLLSDLQGTLGIDASEAGEPEEEPEASRFELAVSVFTEIRFSLSFQESGARFDQTV